MRASFPPVIESPTLNLAVVLCTPRVAGTQEQFFDAGRGEWHAKEVRNLYTCTQDAESEPAELVSGEVFLLLDSRDELWGAAHAENFGDDSGTLPETCNQACVHQYLDTRADLVIGIRGEYRVELQVDLVGGEVAAVWFMSALCFDLCRDLDEAVRQVLLFQCPPLSGRL